MKPFFLLIKPASADCNLRCGYCFYLKKKSELYPGEKRPRMTGEILERLVSSYMGTEQPHYQFCWQGGEPALMGRRFFQKAAELQKKYAPPGAVPANCIQTNATLLDDGLARTLAENKFLAGVSIDGPAELHDRFRKHPGGRGSHAEVLHGIETLRKHNVEFNALVLVNSENVKKGAEIYNCLKARGIFFQQYIPCVEFDGAGGLMPYSVKGPEWGEFLIEIFREWVREDARKVSVGLFDAILNIMVLGRRTLCSTAGDCRHYFLVEHNGDVYPCDFFAEPQRKLGNIMDTGWEEMQNSPEYMEFGKSKSRRDSRCSSCAHLDFCMGDCLKHRIRPGGGPAALSSLCRGWQKFYSAAVPELRKLAGDLKKELPGLQLRPGRNQPCPCGSGVKYKKCCEGKKKFERGGEIL